MSVSSTLVTIVMPTYNSERTLRLSLDSIARQTLRRNMIELIVVDGGSSDRTREIAREFGCLIIDNPRVQPEYAKVLGLSAARSKYAIFLDSDEVLCDASSLVKKIQLLESHQEVKNVITAGLINPPGYPAINDYTNRFGEPFSYFMYRLDGGDYVQSLRERYKFCHEDDSVAIVEFKEGDVLPICDGGGHCFDLDYLKSIADISSIDIVPVTFQYMAERTARLAVVKNDYTLHYSTTSLKRYVNKINWRIITNMHSATGTEGFVNRQKFHPKWFQLKKYLFIVYGLSLLAPLADAIRLAITHKKPAFLLHFPLATYTASFIVLQYMFKRLGIVPKITSYGA